MKGNHKISQADIDAFENRSYPRRIHSPSTQSEPIVLSDSQAFHARAYPSTEDLKRPFPSGPTLIFRVVPSTCLDYKVGPYESVILSDNHIG